MADEGFPPVPPAPGDRPGSGEYPSTPPGPPSAPYPPSPGYPGHPPYGYVAPYSGVPVPGTPYPPSKPKRRWGWWVAGAVVLVVLLGSCTLPFLLLGSGDGLDQLGEGTGVAVIRIDGVIAGTGDYYSGYVTPEYFLDQLEQAEDDDSVKAIVLRVDSPGGTVAASEEIATYVRECDKPVVVSVGDVGASGAYMISSQADQIWANPGSTVGSIGVISEIPNVDKLLDKVGVDFQVIHAGKYKDTGSPYRPMTAEEKALIQGEVDEAYGQFIDIVAKGRKLDRAKVEELATGWAWSGEQAKGLGLVDRIGTYRDALDAAAKRGGIDGDYEVITYGDEFDDILGSLFSLASRLEPLKSLGSRDSLARQALPK